MIALASNGGPTQTMALGSGSAAIDAGDNTVCAAAPVNNLDGAFAEPPVAEREMVVEYDHPDVGKVRLPGNPIKMSGVSGTISRPAPRLGEHTDAVLSRLLRLTPEQIASLRQQGAIK